MIDIYNKPEKIITVLCHTSFGDPNDPLNRFYLKGNEYKMSTEITTDTNNQECILCWINFKNVYGVRMKHILVIKYYKSLFSNMRRFAVKGNIYHEGEPRWPHFTEYFVCPIQRERDNKLNQIGI